VSTDEVSGDRVAPPSVLDIIALGRVQERIATDTGNKMWFTELYRNVVRYSPRHREWFVWMGTNWVMDEGGAYCLALTEGVIEHIRTHALTQSDEPPAGGGRSSRQLWLDHAARTESEAARKKIIGLAVDDERLRVDREDFNRSSHDLVTPEGTLDLHTAALRPSHPDDLSTRITRVSYRPELLDDPPPAVKEYLDTFIPEGPGRVDLIFKVLGAQLVGGNPHRLFIIIKGGTTTGKSQLVDTINHALGDYTKTAPASVFRGNLDDKPRPDLIDVVRRRIGFFSEASRAWELHGDRVKALTGDRETTARAMRSDDYVDLLIDFTPVLVTNEMPKVIGVDPATKRRMLVIEFNHTPSKEDQSVRERFVNDRDVQAWVLSKLVWGCVQARVYGLDDALSAFASDTADAFEGLTHVGTFLRWLVDTDQLTVVPEEAWTAYGAKSTYVRLEDMFERYTWWTKQRGNRRDSNERLGYEDFNKELRENHGFERVKSGVWRWHARRLVPLLTFLGGRPTGGESDAQSGEQLGE
jgi:P4 family phage/plasmid primase-like protien